MPAGLARPRDSTGGITLTRTPPSTLTLGITVMTAPLPSLWAGCSPMIGASMIWPETCRSGARIGMALTTADPTRIRQAKQVVHTGSTGAGVGAASVSAAAPPSAASTIRTPTPTAPLVSGLSWRPRGPLDLLPSLPSCPFRARGFCGRRPRKIWSCKCRRIQSLAQQAERK